MSRVDNATRLACSIDMRSIGSRRREEAAVQSSPKTIYKIADAAAWREAESSGHFAGAPIDHRDGFIHFSTATQVRETAARHFAGVDNLVLAAIDAVALGAALKWEPSRGG